MTIGAKEIKEGGKVAVELSDPRVFPAVVASVALVAVGAMVYWQRQDMHEERTAFLAALQSNTHAIERLTDEVRAERRTR